MTSLDGVRHVASNHCRKYTEPVFAHLQIYSILDLWLAGGDIYMNLIFTYLTLFLYNNFLFIWYW